MTFKKNTLGRCEILLTTSNLISSLIQKDAMPRSHFQTYGLKWISKGLNTFSKNKSVLEVISKQGISEMPLILKSSESREL